MGLVSGYMEVWGTTLCLCTCGGFIIKKDELYSQTALGSDPGPAPHSWMILNTGRPARGRGQGV